MIPEMSSGMAAALLVLVALIADTLLNGPLGGGNVGDE